MAIVQQTINVPLATNFPMPSRYYIPSSYNFQARIFTEDTTPTPVGTVLFFPGAGATNFLTEGPLVQTLVARGFRVVSFAPFGVANSTVSPYRYNYGNVNAPLFTALWVKTAWEVASLLQEMYQPSSSGPYVILGQSRGGTAALSWAAGYCGDEFPSPEDWQGLKGIIANGSTVGGVGGYSWNDMNRNINSMSNVWALNRIEKTILSFGGADDFAPPDYVKRLQTTIPEDKEMYVVTPGSSFGHNWMDTGAGSLIVANWVEQLMLEQPITLADGTTPAIPGPIMEN